MRKKLIIAEKRDAGQTIASVINSAWKESFRQCSGYMESERYIVSWCKGHLIELAAPQTYDPALAKWTASSLPIIPKTYKYSVIEDSKAQYDILKGLMERDDVIELVNAADSGREGELIFRLVYNQAGCTKPVKRLWVSTTAADDIKAALVSMKSSAEYDSLYFAALCRSVQDWLIGINITRKYSCEYHEKLTVGRVQTPTLAMIVRRDQEVEGFAKTYYYKLSFTDAKGTVFVSGNFDTKEEAEKALKTCSGKPIVVKEQQIKRKKVTPPMLYSTTELQKDAGKLYGLSPKETLDIMQSLYDNHLESYPRTDAVVISSGQRSEFAALLNVVSSVYGWPVLNQPNIDRLVNDAGIEDHPAVTVTREFSAGKRASRPASELQVLDLVANRMMCAAAPDYVYDATRVCAECAGVLFEAKGLVTVSEGWRVYRKAVSKMQPDMPLPDYTSGEQLSLSDAGGIAVQQKETAPPPRYTTSTLLDAMEKAGKKDMDKDVERAGLGTSATRADTIDRLVRTGYVTMNGKRNTLISTEKGRALIRVVPRELREVDLTVLWENKMLEIRRAPADKAKCMADDLIHDTERFVTGLVRDFKKDDSLASTVGKQSGIPSVGVCPACGSPVVLSKNQDKWYCMGYKNGCAFQIWKHGERGVYPTLAASKVELTDKRVEKILKTGKSSKLKLTSKAGKQFEAYLTLSQYAPGRYGLAFEFADKKKKGR